MEEVVATSLSDIIPEEFAELAPIIGKIVRGENLSFQELKNNSYLSCTTIEEHQGNISLFADLCCPNFNWPGTNTIATAQPAPCQYHKAMSFLVQISNTPGFKSIKKSKEVDYNQENYCARLAAYWVILETKADQNYQDKYAEYFSVGYHHNNKFNPKNKFRNLSDTYARAFETFKSFEKEMTTQGTSTNTHHQSLIDNVFPNGFDEADEENYLLEHGIGEYSIYRGLFNMCQDYKANKSRTATDTADTKDGETKLCTCSIYFHYL